MRLSIPTMVLVLLAGVSGLTVLITGADEPKAKPDGEARSDPVEAAFQKLVDAENVWRDEMAATEELAKLGDQAFKRVEGAVRTHENARVRRACFSLLTKNFAKNEIAIDTLIRDGLTDKDSRIRYEAAFYLGDLKVERARDPLRKLMDGDHDDIWIRFTAAKSLAQLGEADVMRVLYDAVVHDNYMPRYLGNTGLKALSGKNLDDFDGYVYGEGAYVSGGNEAMFRFDAVTVVEKKAKRFQAATSYFNWLQKERPDLYKHVTYAPRRD